MSTADGDVDILKFPVPIHHEHDGGRYIGTACGVVTRDPDTGRINVGTYRVQVNGPDIATSYISNGKQGRIQRDKYLQGGQALPDGDRRRHRSRHLYRRALHPVGQRARARLGRRAGRPADRLHRGRADRACRSPRNSEIVLEGEVSPDETAMEGPFGEWTGYYAGDAREEPVIRIKRVYYRNDPILTCAASQKPPHSHLFERCFIRSAGLLDSLEGAGIPDVKGVWVHQAGAGRTFVVVAIRQRYFGHANQAGLVASQVNPTGYVGRYVVVVDDDIDPTDMQDVIWAMGTRTDPKTDFTDPRPQLVVPAGHHGDRREALQLARRHRRLHPLRAAGDLPPRRPDLAELAAEVRARFPDVFA